MDKISPECRSENMRAIQSKDTAPELIVRRIVYGMGYRYRLHVKTLPGKPDLVFKLRRKVIFVHGCFWHQHPEDNCADARLPHSNLKYWQPKLVRNEARDQEHVSKLKSEGWRVLIAWDCQTRDLQSMTARLRKFLN